MPLSVLRGGVNKAYAAKVKNVLSTSTSSNNGEKWSRSTTIDLEKSYFHAVINVDACRSDKAENILSVGGRECSAPSSSSNYMSIYPGFHIYYSKPSKNDWHHGTGTFTNALWFDIIPNATSEDGIYKIFGTIKGDVTIDVKSDGVYVNGTKAIPSSALSGLFTTGSKTLYYSNREGTTSSDQASNAIYKEISVVTEQNFVVGEATTETELFSQTSSNNGEKWAKTTTIDFANQYFHVEMNLDECTKSSGNYNLLSVGNRAFSSTYYSIYPGYHIYYAKTKDSHSNVLWFDRIRTSGAGDGFHIYVDNITGDVTIDVKGDGIYVNGVKKVEVSDLSAFFATGSHTLYYSNQEGTNQESYATYKKISVFTTGTVVDNYLREGENNDSQIEEKPSNVKVALERTLLSDGWNTFCVPFTISNEAVKAAFGSDVQLQVQRSGGQHYELHGLQRRGHHGWRALSHQANCRCREPYIRRREHYG